MPYTASKQKALEDLVFDATRHRYSWRGLRVPSVTTVIDDQIGFHGPRDMYEDARERGNEVHHLTALADQQAMGLPGHQRYVSTQYTAYLEAWWKFLDESGFEVQAIEERVFDRRHCFGGTLDRVGLLNDRLTVVDIKTGLVYPQYAWQTAAYKEAANEGRVGPKIEDRLVVQLKSDGTYARVPHTEKHDLQVFLAALLIYNWKGQHNV